MLGLVIYLTSDRERGGQEMRMDHPLGENPPLPMDLVLMLHDRARRLRASLADLAWASAADAAVNLFEGWKKTTP
jgi:hypothetical protein